eukprot:742999-Amphidinium_carterae.1
MRPFCGEFNHFHVWWDYIGLIAQGAQLRHLSISFAKSLVWTLDIAFVLERLLPSDAARVTSSQTADTYQSVEFFLIVRTRYPMRTLENKLQVAQFVEWAPGPKGTKYRYFEKGGLCHNSKYVEH